MCVDSGGVVLEGAYREATWQCQKCTTDKGDENWVGGTSHVFGVLPPGDEDGEMLSDRLSGSSAKHRPYMVLIHVRTLFLVDGCAARG